MWGFCHECLWEKVKEFIRKEKFVPAGCTKDERDQRISTVVRKMDLHRKAQGRLYLLYVLAKAKWSARVRGCSVDCLPPQPVY